MKQNIQSRNHIYGRFERKIEWKKYWRVCLRKLERIKESREGGRIERMKRLIKAGKAECTHTRKQQILAEGLGWKVFIFCGIPFFFKNLIIQGQKQIKEEIPFCFYKENIISRKQKAFQSNPFDRPSFLLSSFCLSIGPKVVCCINQKLLKLYHFNINS